MNNKAKPGRFTVEQILHFTKLNECFIIKIQCILLYWDVYVNDCKSQRSKKTDTWKS